MLNFLGGAGGGFRTLLKGSSSLAPPCYKAGVGVRILLMSLMSQNANTDRMSSLETLGKP